VYKREGGEGNSITSLLDAFDKVHHGNTSSYPYLLHNIRFTPFPCMLTYN
jgi:hypothetical protein